MNFIKLFLVLCCALGFSITVYGHNAGQFLLSIDAEYDYLFDDCLNNMFLAVNLGGVNKEHSKINDKFEGFKFGINIKKNADEQTTYGNFTLFKTINQYEDGWLPPMSLTLIDISRHGIYDYDAVWFEIGKGMKFSLESHDDEYNDRIIDYYPQYCSGLFISGLISAGYRTLQLGSLFNSIDRINPNESNSYGFAGINPKLHYIGENYSLTTYSTGEILVGKSTLYLLAAGMRFDYFLGLGRDGSFDPNYLKFGIDYRFNKVFVNDQFKDNHVISLSISFNNSKRN